MKITIHDDKKEMSFSVRATIEIESHDFVYYISGYGDAKDSATRALLSEVKSVSDQLIKFQNEQKSKIK